MYLTKLGLTIITIFGIAFFMLYYSGFKNSSEMSSKAMLKKRTVRSKLSEDKKVILEEGNDKQSALGKKMAPKFTACAHGNLMANKFLEI